MSELNLLYYLCQCSLGLTPQEAFLSRELRSCPLKQKEIIPEVDKFEGAYSYTDWALSLDSWNFVDLLRGKSERHQSSHSSYICYDVTLIPSKSSFSDYVEYLYEWTYQAEECKLPDDFWTND
jgi:hypothetical protein